jgi:hypothetical protein
LDSILTSIKKLLGGAVNDSHFDTDIIIHINTVLMVLTQLGVGPQDCFFIEDDSATWEDFIPGVPYESVKSYVYLKVKLLFDPPLGAAVIEAINRQISELEWRLQVQADPVNPKC